MKPLQNGDIGAVIEFLRGEILNAADLNAAVGYVLDPGLPAPEVFERPGWRIQFCTHGDPEISVAYLAERLTRSPEVCHEIVRPYEWHEVTFVDGHRQLYGIGFSERTRVWFVFQAGAVNEGGCA